MALTQWNHPSGPGADYRTSDIVIASCLGDPNFPYARPPFSYTINTEGTTVEATAQIDVLSDDRFQRIGRVHLSHPACMMPQPGEYGCSAGKLVFENDLASVWTVTLLSATPEGGIAVPDLQIRIIQAIRGVQITRATALYDAGPPFVPGYVVQLHGVESTDLEIWAWINPADASLTAKVALIFGVSVKMRPSSGDDVIFGDNVIPIP